MEYVKSAHLSQYHKS